MPRTRPVPIITADGNVELAPEEIVAINHWLDRHNGNFGERRPKHVEVTADVLERLLGHAVGTLRPRPASTGGPSYRIGPGGQSITCLKCNMTSYNVNDVVHRYCGNCHEFHEKG